MKIAQVAPLAEAVPPKLYGGTGTGRFLADGELWWPTATTSPSSPAAIRCTSAKLVPLWLPQGFASPASAIIWPATL